MTAQPRTCGAPKQQGPALLHPGRDLPQDARLSTEIPRDENGSPSLGSWPATHRQHSRAPGKAAVPQGGHRSPRRPLATHRRCHTPRSASTTPTAAADCSLCLRTTFTPNITEDPKEFSFMWILAISIYYIQNEKCEIFKTQEFTSTHTEG